MNPAPTFDRTYPQIKRRVLRGDWRPLDRIDAGQLSRELDVSTIPVREVLQRLVGEGLVDLVPGGGFAMPGLTESALRDLLQWHGHLVRIALRHPFESANVSPRVAPDASDDERLALTAEAIFGVIAQGAANAEHARSIVSVGERLRRIRTRESRLIRDIAIELAEVRALTEGGPLEALREALGAYHRRRLRRLPALTASLSSG